MQREKTVPQIEIFFVDPMSVHNLAGYDFELLTNIDKNIKVSFYANEKIDMSVPNVDIKKIYRYSQKKGLFKVISYVKSQIMLLLEVRRRKPDVVHFQWLKLPLVDYWIIMYIKKYSKVIYTSHDAFTHHVESEYKGMFVKILKIVDQVIVHTRTSKRNLTDFIAGEKIEIIKHGLLRLDKYCKKEFDTNKLKKDLNIENEIIFSALGSMEYYKGTDILLEAWHTSEALRKSKKVKLIIAGKNKMGLKRKNIRDDNIIFIDRFISDEEFIALIKLSDVILLPYRKISQSGLLLSAISEEKKVLVSTAGELAELFKYGDVGWILQQTSSEELRDLLEKLLERLHEVTNPVPKLIWHQIKAEYDWASIGEQTSRLYLRTALGPVKDLRYSDE